MLIQGKSPPNIEAKTLTTKPPPHKIVKIGVHIMLDTGEIIGNWLNIEIDNGWLHKLAAKVRATALRTHSGHFGIGLAIKYSNNPEKIMMPKVDPAESAKDTLTEVLASILIKIIMQIPSAFSGAGRRLLKNEKRAMYAIKAALSADIGMAAHIK